MSMVKNKVILWGIDDVNTLGVIRELGEYNIDFLFMVKGGVKFASRSKYVKNIKRIKDNDEGLAYLIKTFSKEEYKPIIISTGDVISVFIDLNREQLAPYFILPTTYIKGFVEKYTDKFVMTELASSLGINCPKSKKVMWNTSIDDIEYPCLIKPSHQKPGYYNEFKYKICKDKDVLTNILNKVRHDSEFIVQEFINSDNDLVVYGVRLKSRKTLLAGAILGEHRACGICSHGKISKEIPRSVNVDKLIEFLDYIDYIGPFGFDFGVVGNKAYFYEINLRNDGTCHCFYQAGAKLLIAYIYDCAGLDYSQINLIPKEAWFIDEIHDIENVIEGKLKYSEWKAAQKRSTIFRYKNSLDPEPYKYVKIRKWPEIIKFVILGRYRLQIVALLDKLGIKK